MLEVGGMRRRAWRVARSLVSSRCCGSGRVAGVVLGWAGLGYADGCFVVEGMCGQQAVVGSACGGQKVKMEATLETFVCCQVGGWEGRPAEILPAWAACHLPCMHPGTRQPRVLLHPGLLPAPMSPFLQCAGRSCIMYLLPMNRGIRLSRGRTDRPILWADASRQHSVHTIRSGNET